MPVTKTAKRAQKVSKRKTDVNKLITTQVEIAIRQAKKTKSEKKIRAATSLVDRAKKKKIIHINKAARLKSQLAKLLPQKKAKKKTSPKK